MGDDMPLCLLKLHCSSLSTLSCPPGHVPQLAPVKTPLPHFYLCCLMIMVGIAPFCKTNKPPYPWRSRRTKKTRCPHASAPGPSQKNVASVTLEIENTDSTTSGQASCCHHCCSKSTCWKVVHVFAAFSVIARLFTLETHLHS